MTSVQSLQLLSNGNKVFICLLISFWCFSCSSTKVLNDGNRPQVVKPNTQSPTNEELSTAVPIDTIVWNITSTSDITPITSDMSSEVLPFEQVREDYYNVALLMPFRLTGKAMVDLNPSNQKFAHFYAGLRLALANENTISVASLHTNRSDDNIDHVLNDLSSDTDVIIGPFDRKSIAKVATYGKENKIPVLSPWTASTSVTSDNLFYLQLRPNLSSYWKTMLKHATKEINRSNIRIISNADGSDKSMMSFIQKLNEEESGLPISQPIKEYPVSEDSLLYSDSLIFKMAFEEEVEGFIIPHYNTAKHDKFVYECLRKLNAEKEDRALKVYAMPLAINSDKLDINILSNLDLRICDYRFFDKRSSEYNRFKKEYYESYGWLPTEDSYYGYDVGQLLRLGLKNYGKYFHYYIKENPVPLDQMTIQVMPYYNSEGELLYLMNDHLDIFQFEDSYFGLKNID